MTARASARTDVDQSPVLLADVGGTHARFALARAGHIGNAVTLATADHADLRDALAHAMRVLDAARLGATALCAAGPLRDDAIVLTNCAWQISREALAAATGVADPLLVNDFTALAAALPSLGDTDREQVGGGEPEPGAACAVLGAGTGLGMSGLIPRTDAHEALIAGEGGHADLAAATPDEDRILERLRQRFGHVSLERVLSGDGLCNLYAAMHPDRDAPPAPGIAALAATGDPHALACVQQFSAWLGAVAGDLVLTLGARGGIYLGGGIVPAWGALFPRDVFRARFEDKGRYREYLQGVPAYIITARDPALRGLKRLLERRPSRPAPGDTALR